MHTRNALLTLASFALKATTNEAEELSVYDSLAEVAAATKDANSLVILSAARETAIAIRKADEARIGFRDLTQGQLPLGGDAK